MKIPECGTKFKQLLLIFIFSLFLCVGAEAKGSSGIVHVRGYTKKDGTYVAPHDRTAPNHTKNDNWSTKGNVNPETGKAGTKNGDAQSSGAGVVSSDTHSDKPAASHLNWEKIKPGMTKSTVSSILGEPNMKTNAKWVYTDLGTVSFTSAGLSE